MPVRADRPFRPLLRTLRTTVIVIVVFEVLGYAMGQNLGELLLAGLMGFVLIAGVCILMDRKHIAAVIRARRER